MFPVLPDVPATASCRRRSAQRPGVSPRCSRRTRPLHTGNCCSVGPPTSACAATIPPLHRTTVYPEPLVSFAMALSYRALALGEPRTSPPLFRVSDLAGGRRAAAPWRALALLCRRPELNPL